MQLKCLHVLIDAAAFHLSLCWNYFKIIITWSWFCSVNWMWVAHIISDDDFKKNSSILFYCNFSSHSIDKSQKSPLNFIKLCLYWSWWVNSIVRALNRVCVDVDVCLCGKQWANHDMKSFSKWRCSSHSMWKE